MLITINDYENRDKTSIVEFSCRFGKGRANWIGQRPNRGQIYSVELDFEDTLKVGVNVSRSVSAVPSVSEGDSGVAIVVTVEDVIDNRSAVCRFGEDLVFVEYEGTFFDAGTSVLVYPAKLLVNDRNL